MKHLYAPWRSRYHTERTDGCPFCKQCADANDAAHFIIKRYEYCCVMLNLFPYNAGHLLVIPYAHEASLEQLTQAARAEIMEVATNAVTILKETLHADGINMGLNLGGKAAGGSIPEHVHMHILPRWLGDTSFLVPFAETKPISFDLREIYQKLCTSSRW